jgi:hypothetical protein
MTSRDLYVPPAGAAPAGEAEYTCPLPHIPEAVRTMRHRARTVLRGWAIPAATTDDAVLVISELVTNAIAHALPPRYLFRGPAMGRLAPGSGMAVCPLSYG